MRKTTFIICSSLTAIAVALAWDADAASLFKPAVAPKSKTAPGHFVTPQAVAIDRDAIVAAGVGGLLDVELPDGRRTQLRLTHVQRHDNGDLSWTGKVNGSRDDLLATGTVGATSAYAEIPTEDGTWAVAPSGGQDWLFDKTTTEASLPAPTAAQMDDSPRPPAGPPEIFPKATCAAVTSMPSTRVTIDVLVVMAPDFVSQNGGAAGAETRLNALFNNINAFNTASNVAITYRRVATLNANYQAASTAGDDDSNALSAITNGTGPFGNVAQLRTFYGADMVALFRGSRGNSISGVAWLNGDGNGNMPSSQANYMYSVHGDAAFSNGTLVAHEFGHNLGNAHDRPNAGGDMGSTPYAFGHYVCGTGAVGCGQAGFGDAGTGFGTIMSYVRPTLGKFASPSLSCTGSRSGGLTAACGVADQQDDVRASNCVRQAVAAMRSSWVGSCANPAADADRDGIPDCLEANSGRVNGTRDNDVFTSNLLFAAQQYRDFLSREGDADGLNYWMGALANGSQSRASMVDSYFRSTEFQGAVAPVTRLYFAYFLRIPDYAGLQHWIGQFKAGTSLATISQQFAASPEFAQRYGALNNTQFVTLVYNNVLGRAPDAAGLAHWVGQLQSGAMTRGGVMLAFSESPEYLGVIGNEVYVTMMYTGMLRRAPDSAGFTHWVGSMDRGTSGLTLISQFLGAAEYRQRFLP